MFQNATTQKKRSEGLGFVPPVERRLDDNRARNDDWVDGRLLDLARQKQCYGAVVVLIICIMMDELVQAWTGSQDRSPLEHRRQKQRDGLVSGGSNGMHPRAGPLGAVFPEYDTGRQDGRSSGVQSTPRIGFFDKRGLKHRGVVAKYLQYQDGIVKLSFE